jgi:ribonucleoside-diphosphate reductase alpha chain
MTKKSREHSFERMRAEILRRRYLWKDTNGKVIETVDQMFRRVAKHVAGAEMKYGAVATDTKAFEDQFYQLMKTDKFLPNSPTLMNAGRRQSMLSACFVLLVEDSIIGIFDAVKNAALIQKAGGGTGFSFDRLRPTGDIVKSSGGTTSGPISFMTVFSTATGAIQQGAFRRGANMAMMSVQHPDILRFIYAKQDLAALNNFNISVKIPNAFVRQLKDNPDASHIVINPRTNKKYVIPDFVDPHSYTISDLIPEDQATEGLYTVGEIWAVIVRNAWAAGEPGVCFIDRINESNTTPHVGQIEATNPCGDQPLLPYEACNLGSINVSKFVNKQRTDLNWTGLVKTARLDLRFFDNVIDVNHYPIPEIEKLTIGNRKIGLGIMGLADTLILLGIRYDSEEAVKFAEKVASFIQNHAHQASESLAKSLGCFPNWKGSVWDTMHHKPMRNAAVTSIAPTGTISIMAGCTGGIEPVFALSSKRRALDGGEFSHLHPLLERLGREEGWLTDQINGQLHEGVPVREIPQIPPELASVLITAHEVPLKWHVRIQAAFQKYTDNAVSKTVNLPSHATIEDVDKAYRQAYELRCKGITVYRDGCRENQVITAAHKTSQFDVKAPFPRPRPKTTAGSTTKAKAGCGSLFITINKDKEGLFEVFTNLGKAGGCPPQSEATVRLVSTALRSGIDPRILIEQLKGIRCLSTMARKKVNKDIEVLSCPDAIARALEEALRKNLEIQSTFSINKCPDCGHPLRREEGCNVCDNCGFSRCR